MELKPNSLLLIDIDGTLTLNNGGWTEEECLQATPNQAMIDWVNARYKELHHIIIFTARHESLRQATNYWLKKHKIYYHALRMNKIGCDLLIDDKTCRPEEIVEEKRDVIALTVSPWKTGYYRNYPTNYLATNLIHLLPGLQC